MVKHALTCLASFGVTSQEVEWERSTEVEVERLKNEAFHATDLSARVRVVGDVLEVADLGRVHLLVFRRNQH